MNGFSIEHKKYLIFFRTGYGNQNTPIDQRRYQCNIVCGESIEGTRSEIRSQIKDYIPLFIDPRWDMETSIHKIPVDKLPIIAER